jgi:hypothetical protein
MTIHLRGIHLVSVALAIVLAATLTTCGKVESVVDAPSSGSDAPGSNGGTCTWDRSNWDGCTFAP